MPADGPRAKLQTLRKRREFLDAARARRSAAPGLVVQAIRRKDGGPSNLSEDGIGVGYTASKKVGNAVQRNRAKRRLRALARSMLGDLGVPGHNYVLIARQATLNRPFSDLQRDLSGCIARLDKQAGRSDNRGRPVRRSNNHRPNNRWSNGQQSKGQPA